EVAISDRLVMVALTDRPLDVGESPPNIGHRLAVVQDRGLRLVRERLGVSENILDLAGEVDGRTRHDYSFFTHAVPVTVALSAARICSVVSLSSVRSHS